MKVQQILKTSTATAALGLAMAAQSAYAQDDTTTATTDSGVIIVTGSLIQNPNLERSAPVNVTTEEEIELKQAVSAENLLREVPGVVPNIGAQVNNGTVGSARVDLRGLGAQRNIVMLNSTRLVPSSFFGAVDLNNIPVALVERVDVLTGGASTTYGADAVTGVVNFITKRDFAGLDVQLTQQISEEGDANLFRGDVVLGANFDDGRGNAVLALSYIEADPLYFAARPLGQCVLNSNTGVCGGDSATATPTAFSFANQTSFLQIAPGGNSLVPQYALFNFNPANVFTTPFERFNTYAQADYDVNDRVTVYGRGMFSKNTVQQIIASSGVFGENLTVPGNNPFLPAGIRDQLCTINGIALGPTCNNNAAIPLGAVYRRSVELGPRISTYVTQIFDMKAGLTVNLFGDIDFDIYGTYGESENAETRSGYVAKSRLQQALNATNATTCTNTANGCVPLNLFGQPGSITPAMGGFIGGITSTTVNFASLSQVHATIGGDTGISLLGAEPIAFAIGAEQRKYIAERRPDNLAQVPGELGGAGGAVLPLTGGYKAQDVFAELIVPVISDRPFFNELTLEAGVRYSQYKIDAPTDPEFDATTWKLGGTYSPIPALTFRGSYQKAVRAPNIGELFAPVTSFLTNLAIDPCAGAAPLGNPNLLAVCLAQGAPTASIGNIQQPVSGQARATGGGNPLVGPESAKTLTAGVLFTPDAWLPGFNMSIDYYRIKVTDAITSPLPGDIINACFGSLSASSATNPACTSIIRNPANGSLSGSPATTPGLPAPLSNAGTLFTDGVDLIMNYRTDVGFADLDLNFSGNWTDDSYFDASAADTTNVFPNCPGLYSANCGIAIGSLQPEFSWTQRTTLDFGDIDLSLLWRHISSFQYQPDLPPLCGPTSTNATCRANNNTVTGTGNFATPRTNPFIGQTLNANFVPSYDYFDFTARFQATDALTFTGTVFNLFDKKAPLLGSQAGTTSANSGNTFPSTYDVIGRRYSVTARLRF